MTNNTEFLAKVLTNEVGILLSCTFAFTFIGFFFLTKLHNFESGFLKRIFYVPARKSTTNAVQLGGLPLSLGIVGSVLFIYLTPSFEQFFDQYQLKVIKYWLISSSILITYGYLDDKYELRPIVKLIFQFMTVTIFSIMASHMIYYKLSSAAFVVMFFFGMGVLNGSNLLDGLDTLTIKLASVTFGALFVCGLNFQSPAVVITSLITFTTLASFYFFNKEPAKIHLGEIGGSFIGFTGLLCANLLFIDMIDMRIGRIESFAMSLIPLVLPMVELGLSFLRRIYNRKSPFKGDKYHVHHILRNYHKFSPSAASSLMGISYGWSMVVTFTITHWVGPVVGFFAMTTFLCALYLTVGAKHWHTAKSIELTPTALFNYLRKKEVSVINSQSIDSFEFHISTEGLEDDLLNDELPNGSEPAGSDKDDDKKAA
ncbi:MAG: undecaprenyl/decaprenyl-phosphate alpha-N-acetylglucosaminyl 1-phosphate transferase [Oligoflexia bacterium]|nr:undecaprenyl/decaprenyl-phosphate alpha-N-acetylglucosaminyl 1-phosphate transferase [Oligoflexia bacterium]